MDCGARLVIHFDYDCFYAAVFERETPALRSVPLAVQQKQIVVTANYAARERGVRKLQLITDAKFVCPELTVVLGEDLTRFRNASKALYNFLRSFSWNGRCERLGFDEVFMDVSDMVAYNASVLNVNTSNASFFYLSKQDPTIGFSFDATRLPGFTYPQILGQDMNIDLQEPSQLRLILASHLAFYLRQLLESEQGYTATAGISTNKLLAKLVGHHHKPNGQTTLWSPYTVQDCDEKGTVATFLDDHEIEALPGVGFTIAQKLRAHVLARPGAIHTGLVYGLTKDHVTVADVRGHPSFRECRGPKLLEQILSGPGASRGIGRRIWDLLHGIDDAEVKEARRVPKQISFEDSYLRLNSIDQVRTELHMLAASLLKRMRIDLMDEVNDTNQAWIAYPTTIRLTTRPRPAPNPNGSRSRSFARISKSVRAPDFILSLKLSGDIKAERLVRECLMPLFHKLHPEKCGWNLSLVNVAATNIVEMADEKGGAGKDIGRMFKEQTAVLQRCMAAASSVPIGGETLSDEPPSCTAPVGLDQSILGSEDAVDSTQKSTSSSNEWLLDEDFMDNDNAGLHQCIECQGTMPIFAMPAHIRWHRRHRTENTSESKT